VRLYSRPDPLEARAALTPDHLVFVLIHYLTLGSGLSGEAVTHGLSRRSSMRQGATAVRINLREGIPAIILIRERY
jgi:hypothetical protein